jgi:hypothetical protein
VKQLPEAAATVEAKPVTNGCSGPRLTINGIDQNDATATRQVTGTLLQQREKRRRPGTLGKVFKRPRGVSSPKNPPQMLLLDLMMMTEGCSYEGVDF